MCSHWHLDRLSGDSGAELVSGSPWADVAVVVMLCACGGMEGAIGPGCVPSAGDRLTGELIQSLCGVGCPVWVQGSVMSALLRLRAVAGVVLRRAAALTSQCTV
ncbi:hypothetical protein ILYODFUR_027875 [Ilyodon furcidens]|uniref:Uncharacterized protein n=1 Tax=Ilyodon furcidens TaxID=33524 RepID=A0ABV0TZH3_9TELE